MRCLVALAVLVLAGCGSRPAPAAAPSQPPKTEALAAEPSQPPKTEAPASPARPAEAPSTAAAGTTVEPRPRAAAAVTDFTLSVVRHTKPFERRNFVIAPASIALALGMTQAGARGETARQIASATGLSDDDHAWLSRAYRALADRAAKHGHALESANRLFLKTGSPIESAYQDLLQARYRAPVEQLDFTRAPDESRRHINAWVARSTRDKIEQLLGPPAVRADTLAVLVNALYLAATWQNAFDPAATRPGPFRAPDGRRVEVPMMQRRGGFAFANSPEALVVELPYAGEELVMSIVMPQGTTQLPAMLAMLGSADLSRWLDAVEPSQSAELLLPRFALETASQDLIPALSKLGITDLFSHADLSGISAELADTVVSAVVHGARVEVDERGTVAAAATAVVISKARPQRIAVDAPFLFFVRDRASGLVLFTGQVVDPAAG